MKGEPLLLGKRDTSPVGNCSHQQGKGHNGYNNRYQPYSPGGVVEAQTDQGDNGDAQAEAKSYPLNPIKVSLSWKEGGDEHIPWHKEHHQKTDGDSQEQAAQRGEGEEQNRQGKHHRCQEICWHLL